MKQQNAAQNAAINDILHENEPQKRSNNWVLSAAIAAAMLVLQVVAVWQPVSATVGQGLLTASLLLLQRGVLAAAWQQKNGGLRLSIFAVCAALAGGVWQLVRTVSGSVTTNWFFLTAAAALLGAALSQQSAALAEPSERTELQRQSEKLAQLLPSIVGGLAVVTLAGWLLAGQGLPAALSRAVAVLSVGCSAALLLIVPTMLRSALQAASARHILFRSPQALENLAQVTEVVLGKGGVLLRGRPIVTDVVPMGVTEPVLLSIAAALAQQDTQPSSVAILQKAQKSGVQPLSVEQLAAEQDLGISAIVQGVHCMAGNRRMLLKNGLALSLSAKQQGDALSAEGKVPLYVAANKHIIGLLALAEVLRPDSDEIVVALHEKKLHVTLLSEDHEDTAAGVAKALGTDAVLAAVPQAEQAQQIRALQQNGARLLMIGDGAGDAEALAEAFVSLTAGSSAADILLPAGALPQAGEAFALAQQAARLVRRLLCGVCAFQVVALVLAALALPPVLYPVAAALCTVVVRRRTERQPWLNETKYSVREALGLEK